MIRKKASLAISLFLLLAWCAGAQIIQTGTLSGTVQEKDKSALPGVAVTITSPALIVPQMSAVASERGFYRFPALPPGLYKVTFELTGFQTLVRDDIRITVGQTTAFSRRPPHSSVAPFETASRIHSSTRSASLTEIIAHTSVVSSREDPAFSVSA